MAVQFVCGAECKVVTGAAGSGRHWNANTGTITTTTGEPGGGSFAFDFNSSAATLFHTLTLAQNVLAGRFYLKFTTIAAANVTIFRGLNASGDSVDIRISSAGQIFLSINGNAGVNIGSPISTGAWHYVDFVMDTTSTSATLKGALDGGTQQTNNGTLAATGLTGIRVGIITSSTSRWAMDHLILGNASGDFPFGAGRVTGYAVNTTSGTHNTPADFTLSSGGSPSNGDSSGSLVQDLPGDTTSHVDQTTIGTGAYWEGVYATSAETGTPRGVEQVVSIFAANTSADTQKAQLFDGTTASDTYALGTVGSASVINLTKQWASAPSGAWTNALLKATRIRWGFSDDVTPIPSLTSTILEAEFAPAAAAASLIVRTRARQHYLVR